MSKKQKTSSDELDDTIIKKLSIQIQRIDENFRLIKFFEEIPQNEIKTQNWFEYTDIVKDLHISEPPSKEFNLAQSQNFQKTLNTVNENNSSYDIIKDNHNIAITINMPDIKKRSIHLKIDNDNLVILADKSKGNYYRVVKLGCKVKPKSARFTYNNGILDIIISRDTREY